TRSRPGTPARRQTAIGARESPCAVSPNHDNRHFRGNDRSYSAAAGSSYNCLRIRRKDRDMNIPWWGYVIGAGLAWGTYVPLVFYGGTELTTRPGTIGGRLASILCVGVAYFVLAVIVPIALMSVRDDAKPVWKPTGLVFSSLA